MTTFSRARVRSVSTLALATALVLVPGVAYAEGESEVAGDEIIVEGIRGSLTKSIDLKRNADSIVDAISAEEVGKFPDNNVAEALQRITGVAIDRAGGEGQFITVRGFGPQFNTVLVNGRTMATENAGREFSFDVLASEIIQTAEVFKSPTARLQEGGIGATVNIRTARPLDRSGTHFNISAQGEYNTLTKDVSPRLSAIFSSTNADSTFGVFASVVYSNRDSIRDSVSTEGWINGNAWVLDSDNIGYNQLTNINVPRSYRIQRIDENRERLTATMTVQGKLSDDLTLTLDGLYSKYDVKSLANAFQAYFTDPFLSMTLDANRTAITLVRPGSSSLAALDNTVALVDFGGRTTRQVATDSLAQNDNIRIGDNRNTTTYAGGLNLAYQPDSGLEVSFDYGYSRADKDFVNPFVNAGWLQTANAVFDVTAPGAFPSYTSDPSNNVGVLRAHYSDIRGGSVSDDVHEGRLDLNFKFDEGTLQNIRIGALASQRVKQKSVSNSGWPNACAYCGYFADLPDSILSQYNPSGFMKDYVGTIPRTWVTFNPFDVIDFLESPAGISQIPPGHWAGGPAIKAADGNIYGLKEDLNQQTYVRERILAGYAEVGFGGDSWSGNIGLRIAKTNTLSRGYGSEVLSVIDPGPGDDALIITFGPYTQLAVSNEYTDILPSANFKYDIQDDLVLRLAVGKTVTRPTLTSLGVDNFYNNRKTNLTSGGGNPFLKPFQAWNFDVSLEYYFSRFGFVGATVFHKEISEFITATTVPVVRSGFTFQDTRLRNQEKASATGFELAFQSNFDFLGPVFENFGTQLNYTYIKSNAKFDPAQVGGTQFSLEGLSPHSFNATLFYEDGPFSARASYNWRDEFLIGASRQQGQPEQREAYGQLDVSASYDINDNFTVFAEGINVLGSDFRDFSRYANRLINLEDSGVRYALGVRAKF